MAVAAPVVRPDRMAEVTEVPETMLHRCTIRRRSVWGRLGRVLRSRDRTAAGTRPFELALMMFAGPALAVLRYLNG
jgi:hypothetical protein